MNYKVMYGKVPSKKGGRERKRTSKRWHFVIDPMNVITIIQQTHSFTDANLEFKIRNAIDDLNNTL